jgi:hypothetical protein
VGGQGGASATCDLTPCEGVEILGNPLPACCMTATQCGVSAGGQCIDRAQIPSPGDGGFPNIQEEPIVSDPACQGTTLNFMGQSIDMPGCCDPSGVCGNSTENFPPFGGGFTIPTMCVTSTEAGQFGQGPVGGADAGPDVPCTYPDAGN